MKKFIRYFFRVLLVALITIQFFRPARNTSPGDQPNHISKIFPVPDSVNAVLKTACNDCHSNNTVYPWYSNVQPIAWWLDDHVKEGKRKLNLDEFKNYNLRRQFHKLEEINEMVKEGEMPLSSYTVIHRDAKLNDAQKLLIANWTVALQDSMKAHYPIDSLVSKRK